MAALTLPSYRVEDLDGRPVEAKIEDLGANFEYDLPKDKFRQARIARQVRVTIPVHLAPLSWTTFQLLEGEQEHRDGIYQNGVIDTPFVTVSVDDNIIVYDKTTHEAYEDFYPLRSTVVTSETSISISNQKEQSQSMQSLRATRSWKTQLATLRFCSNMN